MRFASHLTEDALRDVVVAAPIGCPLDKSILDLGSADKSATKGPAPRLIATLADLHEKLAGSYRQCYHESFITRPIRARASLVWRKFAPRSPTAVLTSPYYFRSFVRADLFMVGRWLRTPEVVRWWGDAVEQEVLVRQDLDEPIMRQWIVEYEQHPFAYTQAYPAHAWPQAHLAHLPDGAAVIDAFIGEPAMLGRGHGSRFLRRLAEMLLAEGAPVVAIDPALDNHRARRAYAHAGFVAQREVETEHGFAVVMLFR
jgi:aminoglycoside 6'-N-acetyltransferase